MGVLRRAGAGFLVGALAAGCGLEAAAPANVEGTVQARVSATVAAVVRTQVTPTRPLGATTVAAIGSPSPGPALSPAPNTAGIGTPLVTVAATIGAGTPAATASGTPSTATPVRTSTPGGTPGAATPTPPGATLALGATAPVGGLALTINRYEWNTNCPAGGARAGTGRKFVVLQAVGRNEGAGAASATAAQWSIDSGAGSGFPTGSSVPCRPEGASFEEACYRSGAIPAGGRCEGWLLFEVPEEVSVPGAVVSARVVGTGAEGRWRLPT
ncbi:MAG TPA: hypothetical protein VFX49_17030 [Chloroflexota bacterium]|nr:hypothetical protein [Chloroflexota bacterium]